jgi:hypothetical protein
LKSFPFLPIINFSSILMHQNCWIFPWLIIPFKVAETLSINKRLNQTLLYHLLFLIDFSTGQQHWYLKISWRIFFLCKVSNSYRHRLNTHGCWSEQFLNQWWVSSGSSTMTNPIELKCQNMCDWLGSQRFFCCAIFQHKWPTCIIHIVKHLKVFVYMYKTLPLIVQVETHEVMFIRGFCVFHPHVSKHDDDYTFEDSCKFIRCITGDLRGGSSHLLFLMWLLQSLSRTIFDAGNIMRD